MSNKDKKKSKNNKDSRKNGKAKRHADTGASEIAKAERKLESTLHKLEDVRAELAEREATLRELLTRYGRMPDDVAEPEPETEPLLDQQQVVHPLDGLTDANDAADAVVSVPLLDQQQVLDVGSREPMEHENQ